VDYFLRNWSAFAPALLIGFVYYAVVIFCVWKFYQMLSRINGNLAQIKLAIDGVRVKADGE
jgi:hypothetical protein